MRAKQATAAARSRNARAFFPQIRGGGVYNTGTFTMSGNAQIQNNTATSGGGVFNTGTFTMSGGTISGNTTGSYSSGGGGVYNTGTFTMSGNAQIQNNTASKGGAVFMIGGTFTMSGGTISGNNATESHSGGVSVDGGTFTMTNGTIRDNGGAGNSFDVYARQRTIGLSVVSTVRYVSGTISNANADYCVRVMSGVQYAYGASATPQTLTADITTVEGLQNPQYTQPTPYTIDGMINKSLDDIRALSDGKPHTVAVTGTLDYTVLGDIASAIEAVSSGATVSLNLSATTGLTSIYDSAFSGCTALAGITIPSSVTSIGRWAFQHCTSLSDVTISNSVMSIGEAAFQDCTALASIVIPTNSVRIIGDSAFSGTALASIEIPASVTSIGNYAFYDCTALAGATFKTTSGWSYYTTMYHDATAVANVSSSPAVNATNLKSYSGVWSNGLIRQ